MHTQQHTHVHTYTVFHCRVVRVAAHPQVLLYKRQQANQLLLPLELVAVQPEPTGSPGELPLQPATTIITITTLKLVMVTMVF